MKVIEKHYNRRRPGIRVRTVVASPSEVPADEASLFALHKGVAQDAADDHQRQRRLLQVLEP